MLHGMLSCCVLCCMLPAACACFSVYLSLKHSPATSSRAAAGRRRNDHLQLHTRLRILNTCPVEIACALNSAMNARTKRVFLHCCCIQGPTIEISGPHIMLARLAGSMLHVQDDVSGPRQQDAESLAIVSLQAP